MRATQKVPLRKELDFLERYLEIEKIRFESRLSVEFDIDPGVLDARVPNLLLQPLVENAIRHGIGNSAEGGMVSIVARRAGTRLELEVTDTGAATMNPMLPVRKGVGIANTQARLERLYGSAHQFVLRQGTRGGIECRITMPLLSQEPGIDKPSLPAPVHAHG